MAGFGIDLGKLVPERARDALARVVPDGARNAVERAAKVADVATLTFDAVEGDRVQHPVVFRRLARCTLPTRAHILGLADLPAMSIDPGPTLWAALLRVRVEHPAGDAETCVRQQIPHALRRVALGSSLRALADPDDARSAVLDWKVSAAALGLALEVDPRLAQYAWPDQDDWPAAGTVEVRDTLLRRRELERRRADGTPAVARLLGASPGGGMTDGRERWRLELEVDGRRVGVKERVPALALIRLVGWAAGGARLGGLVRQVDTVVDVGATLSALVGRDGEVAIDWEATLGQPGWGT